MLMFFVWLFFYTQAFLMRRSLLESSLVKEPINHPQGLYHTEISLHYISEFWQQFPFTFSPVPPRQTVLGNPLCFKVLKQKIGRPAWRRSFARIGTRYTQRHCGTCLRYCTPLLHPGPLSKHCSCCKSVHYHLHVIAAARFLTDSSVCFFHFLFVL